MATLLTETPLTPRSTVGPYRVADYASMPDEPRCELINGRLYVSPSPVTAHQVTVARLWVLLELLAERSRGLALFAPMDVTLAEHSVVQPDVIYVSEARRSIVHDRVEGAPDLLIEVLSPATTRRDRGEKLELYAKAGITEYWVVDPVARQIDFLVQAGGRFAVELAHDGVYRSRAIAGLELDVIALWAAVDTRLGHAEGGESTP